MNKVKIITDYIIGFIISILIVILIILLIIKTTIYNKNYIKNTLDKNNYYELVYNDTLETMKSYMISSGLPESILNNLYNKEDVKKDVNLFIDNVYLNKNIHYENSNVKKNLNENIDTYLNNHNIEITSRNDIDSFILEMCNIYDNEIHFYNIMNSYISIFNKLSKVIDIIIIVVIVLLIVLFIVLKLISGKTILSSIMSSGLILLFIKFILYDKIDYGNILVIGEEFSIILRSILNKIGDLFIYYGIILILISIIMIIISLMKYKKE